MRNAAKLEAENKAKEIELRARGEQLKFKEQFEKETQGARNAMKDAELRMNKREDILDKKLDTLTVKERHLEDLESRVANKQKSVDAKDEQLTKTLAEQRERLLQISNLSADQAKDMLLKRIEDECRHEAGELILKIVDQAQEEAKEKSRQIIL